MTAPASAPSHQITAALPPSVRLAAVTAGSGNGPPLPAILGSSRGAPSFRAANCRQGVKSLPALSLVFQRRFDPQLVQSRADRIAHRRPFARRLACKPAARSIISHPHPHQ